MPKKTFTLSEADYKRLIGIQQVVDKVKDIEDTLTEIEEILGRMHMDFKDRELVGGWYHKLSDYKHGDEVDVTRELLRKLRSDMYDVATRNRELKKA